MAEDHSHVDTFDTGGISHFTVLQHLNEIKCLNGLSTLARALRFLRARGCEDGQRGRLITARV
jgi:hypothetical protein